MSAGAWLLAGLLGPTWSVGAGGGVGSVDESAVVLTTPWLGVQTGSLTLALQAPLRIRTDSSGLRDQDWDEASDHGRLIRFVRYQDQLGAHQLDAHIGVISQLTLGHGTLVRRFHNGTVDDNHRTGALLRLAEPGDDGRPESGSGMLLFADQIFGVPVTGGRGWTSFSDRLTVGLTFVADPEAPSQPGLEIDEARRFTADTDFLTGYGADLGLRLFESTPMDVDLYADVNAIDGSDAGLHAGAEITLRNGPWRLSLSGEYMHLGEGYDWAWFDTAYLIDRWRPRRVRLDPLPSATGGRARMVAGYEALEAGWAFADATGGERGDLSAWLTVPTNNITVSGFYFRRDGDVANPDESLAALSASWRFADELWISATLARVWRVQRISEQPDVVFIDAPATRGRFRPITEGSVMIGFELGE